LKRGFGTALMVLGLLGIVPATDIAKTPRAVGSWGGTIHPHFNLSATRTTSPAIASGLLFMDAAQLGAALLS
jgi:hypothetical protein